MNIKVGGGLIIGKNIMIIVREKTGGQQFQVTVDAPESETILRLSPHEMTRVLNAKGDIEEKILASGIVFRPKGEDQSEIAK